MLVMASLSNRKTKWSTLLTVPSAKSLKPTTFSIESDSGIELFVHFGIDTVELKGEGFSAAWLEEGQRVKALAIRLVFRSAAAVPVPSLPRDSGCYLQHG